MSVTLHDTHRVGVNPYHFTVVVYAGLHRARKVKCGSGPFPLEHESMGNATRIDKELHHGASVVESHSLGTGV